MEKKLITMPGSYGIVIEGQLFYFEYEEMVELLGAGRDSDSGNEYLHPMKRKCLRLFDLLPDTAY